MKRKYVTVRLTLNQAKRAEKAILWQQETVATHADTPVPVWVQHGIFDVRHALMSAIDEFEESR